MKIVSGQEQTIQAPAPRSVVEAHQQHQKLNAANEQRYHALSYFEREEIIRWLKNNLTAIPILAKTKNTGMQEIIAGHTESNSALMLIRYALQALRLL